MLSGVEVTYFSVHVAPYNCVARRNESDEVHPADWLCGDKIRTGTWAVMCSSTCTNIRTGMRPNMSIAICTKWVTKNASASDLLKKRE